MRADGDVVSKGRGNWPTQNDSRDEMLTSFGVESGEDVERPDFWLRKTHTYQAWDVQEPEKKITNSEIGGGGGMVEVGRRG